MKLIAILVILFAVYATLLVPFTQHLQTKPFLEKVGYVPEPLVVKMLAFDQRHAVAAGLIFRVLIYYGTLVEKKRITTTPPDDSSMRAILSVTSRLDPYNMDTYYFAQSLVWDEVKVRETIKLLEYGMRFRDWDFYLPFFAGFNYAFFLKDYKAAATHYTTAARLTGSDLFSRLASRYMYESGQTELAIGYLDAMIKSSRNEAIKKSFETRRSALLEVRRIEMARDRYREQFGRLPALLGELFDQGLLTRPVIDPYGGVFYIESDGTVRSTSKFAGRTENND